MFLRKVATEEGLPDACQPFFRYLPMKTDAADTEKIYRAAPEKGCRLFRLCHLDGW
jgi:hypothetical protein